MSEEKGKTRERSVTKLFFKKINDNVFSVSKGTAQRTVKQKSSCQMICGDVAV